MPPDYRRNRWDETIKRVLRHELEWHRKVAVAVSEVRDIRPPEPVRPLFGTIVRAVYDRTIGDAAVECFDEIGRGQLAARVVLWCLRTSGIEHPGLDEEIDGGKNAAEAAVRDIQQCFANESGHFKKGLVTELVAETAQSPD